MKYLLILIILLISVNCYADKYKKIESQVKRYESIGTSLENIKSIGNDYYSKGLINEVEHNKLKASHNRKYDKFIETAYMLEEIIIIEGGLTMDDMIVPMSERKECIDDIGKRKYSKTVNEIIVDIDRNLKVLSGYIGEVYRYYGQKQRREKEEIQKAVR